MLEEVLPIRKFSQPPVQARPSVVYNKETLVVILYWEVGLALSLELLKNTFFIGFEKLSCRLLQGQALKAEGKTNLLLLSYLSQNRQSK